MSLSYTELGKELDKAENHIIDLEAERAYLTSKLVRVEKNSAELLEQLIQTKAAIRLGRTYEVKERFDEALASTHLTLTPIDVNISLPPITEADRYDISHQLALIIIHKWLAASCQTKTP